MGSFISAITEIAETCKKWFVDASEACKNWMKSVMEAIKDFINEIFPSFPKSKDTDESDHRDNLRQLNEEHILQLINITQQHEEYMEQDQVKFDRQLTALEVQNEDKIRQDEEEHEAIVQQLRQRVKQKDVLH